MFFPKNVVFTDSLLPMKGFPQSVSLIFHYRITGDLQFCHVTGKYYSLLYPLVKGIFLSHFASILSGLPTGAYAQS